MSDEAIDVDLIKRVGIGGNYLTEPETAESFRDWLNSIAVSSPSIRGRQTPANRESKRWEQMARDKVEELLENDLEPVLTTEQERAVDDIVAEAEGKTFTSRGSFDGKVS